MSNKEPKLTPWFVNGEKPARIGIYQQMCALGEDVGYQKWDGHFWYDWRHSIVDAALVCDTVDPKHEHDPWRGLAEKP